MGKMKANVFVEKAVEIAKNFKTLYVMGCFGAPLTGSNVSRYCNNHSYNRAADRTAMIKAAGNQNPPVYGFDCVCLIKGILWGWSGNASKTYGGANYASNGVPDIGADTMITRCLDVSATGWANMAVGEAVWMSGHIGIYIGDGLAVECSPKWENKVQITAVGNIGSKAGYNTRTWTKHGKLPYVDYSESGTTTGGGTATKPDTGGATIYKVAAGDNLSKIAAKYGTTVDALAEINAIKNKNLIRVGQVLMLQDTPQAAADKLEALGVINSPDYWAEAAEAGKVQYLDILLKKAAQTITKAGVRGGLGALGNVGRQGIRRGGLLRLLLVLRVFTGGPEHGGHAVPFRDDILPVVVRVDLRPALLAIPAECHRFGCALDDLHHENTVVITGAGGVIRFSDFKDTHFSDLPEKILRNNRRSGTNKATKMTRKIRIFIACPPIDKEPRFVYIWGAEVRASAPRAFTSRAISGLPLLSGRRSCPPECRPGSQPFWRAAP